MGFCRSIHGTIFGYNKQFDGVNTRNEKPLEVKDMLRYNTTTSDDPIITELAQKEEAQVYTTDAILSVLMTATRSVNSWDIVVTKEGNNIYFDKREGGPFGAFFSTRSLSSSRSSCSRLCDRQ